MGGTAFLKSPVGREFFEFFGESMFRADASVSVGSLGSLMEVHLFYFSVSRFFLAYSGIL